VDERIGGHGVKSVAFWKLEVGGWTEEAEALAAGESRRESERVLPGILVNRFAAFHGCLSDFHQVSRSKGTGETQQVGGLERTTEMSHTATMGTRQAA